MRTLSYDLYLNENKVNNTPDYKVAEEWKAQRGGRSYRAIMSEYHIPEDETARAARLARIAKRAAMAK